MDVDLVGEVLEQLFIHLDDQAVFPLELVDVGEPLAVPVVLRVQLGRPLEVDDGFVGLVQGRLAEAEVIIGGVIAGLRLDQDFQHGPGTGEISVVIGRYGVNQPVFRPLGDEDASEERKREDDDGQSFHSDAIKALRGVLQK